MCALERREALKLWKGIRKWGGEKGGEPHGETSSEMPFTRLSPAPLGLGKGMPLSCTHSSSVMLAKEPGGEKETCVFF